jgi:haloalkane dehalogenase
MAVLRAPDHRFDNLPDFPFKPHYTELTDPDHGTLRMHHLDEGPADGPIVLCLHGEPTWSFLYRKMIPVLAANGCRTLAPDFVGFGRSDKLSERNDYSYLKHVTWVTQWIHQQGLEEITLLGQDWGGLIGLRVLAENPDWFSRFSLSNTFLPTGDHDLGKQFRRWRQFSQEDPEFDPGFVVNLFDHGHLTDAEKDAYRAPFPAEEYLAGARQFPMLVPDRPDDPASEANRAAWKVLKQWQKPALMCFSDADLIMNGLDKVFLDNVPGTSGQPHITLKGAHFIQEQDGETWAAAVSSWIRDTS